MELRTRHYYLKESEKKVVHTGTLQSVIPDGYEYLGPHEHPDPRMAVVSFLGREATGYTIVKNPHDL
jgi:hypothetical protein